MSVDLLAFPPLAALLDAASHALTALTDLLTFLPGDAGAAAAIVLVTLVVRAALVPAGIAQARAEQARARLAPQLRALRRRYGRNPERLQRETMQLYRDEGVSPMAGCLPLAVQAPIVGLVYAVFTQPMLAGRTNPLLSETLFDVPLGASLAGSVVRGTADALTWAVLGGLVVLVAAIGEATRRAFRPPAPDPESPVPAIPRGVLEVLPFATAAVTVFVPLAAGLYLLITVAWTFGQRLVLRRRYPLP